MQNRYIGDAGDFGKFGLMRELARQDSWLRLGLIWYLNPHEEEGADGKHVRYLGVSPKNERYYRACDPELYDRLKALVESGLRAVSAIPLLGILPPRTVYFEEPLSRGGPPSARLAGREAWLNRALAATTDCDVVVLDPDNGLECGAKKGEVRACKYVYLDEIEPLLKRHQTVVLYQHLDRSSTADVQIGRRGRRLEDELNLRAMPVALRHRSGSSRVYYFLAQPEHENAVRRTVATLTSGSWSRHFSPVG